MKAYQPESDNQSNDYAQRVRIATGQSAAIAHEKGETPGVAAVAAWFDVLEAAQDTLHNVQYPLRAMELPPYPAGGVCGVANLGIALDHIIEAQKALDLVTEQLRHWRAMNEAYGPSSNTQISVRVDEKKT